MATKTLTVALPEDLYQKFIETVTESEGPWRRRYETVAEAIDGAVTAALMLFLQDLTEESAELPEFRDYMHEKYPELHEDLITMMADLIKRERESRDAVTDKMAEEIGEVEKEHPQHFRLMDGYQI